MYEKYFTYVIGAIYPLNRVEIVFVWGLIWPDYHSNGKVDIFCCESRMDFCFTTHKTIVLYLPKGVNFRLT